VLDDLPGDERAKRDRTARLLTVVSVLRANGTQGITPLEIAKRTGMAKRTVYRDLKAIDGELGIPVWSEHGRWGVDADAFLPPLRLTLSEAMAIFLSARLLARYMDKHDPVLASAFTKLEEGLPPSLRDHVERTVRDLASRDVDPVFNRHVGDLTRAWADRRVVTFEYAPAPYSGAREPRRATVRPYLLEPSLQTHALYLIGFDEERAAMRTFKVERIRDLAVLPRTFDDPEDDVVAQLRRAWDIIADQPATEVSLRFRPEVAGRVMEAQWHPSQHVSSLPDGSIEWRATVAGTIEIRLWILSWGSDVEVLGPASLRDDVVATLRAALGRYDGPTP
jgi:predicted DNA-binding transcriptional regulator YafY